MHESMTEQITPETVARVVISGDLAALDDVQRAEYYTAVCRSVGLNPLTKPFEFLQLNGKLRLYALRDCADQLRRLHRISIEIVKRERLDDLYIVTARATTPEGRADESTGAVGVKGLVGEGLANALMKAECVPLGSEILTREGWKFHDQLRVGEEVLAYDRHQDQCVWTPLEAVTVYVEALTYRFGTQRHGFRCTPDHSWAATNPYNARGPRTTLSKASHLATVTGRKIILAAVAEGGQSPITPAEAAVLGWVMTDGTIQKRKTFIRLGICQSKEENFDAIELALQASGYHFYKTCTPPSMRDFGRYISACKAQQWWYLSAEDSRALFLKAGIRGSEDLSKLVTQLSLESRKAMFQAMMLADGDARGSFGKKRKPGVMDAWQILATLEGYALGKLSHGREVNTQRARKQRYMVSQNVSLTDPLYTPVWCPTTAHGTWVMRQDGNVVITGNTKAKRRVTLSVAGMGWLDESEIDSVPQPALTPHSAPRRSAPGTKEINERKAELIKEVFALCMAQHPGDDEASIAAKRGLIKRAFDCLPKELHRLPLDAVEVGLARLREIMAEHDVPFGDVPAGVYATPQQIAGLKLLAQQVGEQACSELQDVLDHHPQGLPLASYEVMHAHLKGSRAEAQEGALL